MWLNIYVVISLENFSPLVAAVFFQFIDEFGSAVISALIS